MKGFGWAFSECGVHFAVKVLVIGIIFAALFYGEEDWRGAQALKNYLSHSGKRVGHERIGGAGSFEVKKGRLTSFYVKRSITA
jgi:hypothetical protein